MIAMQAVVANGPEIDDLHQAELPMPEIRSPYDVLVRVRATALNPVDYKVRRRQPIGARVVLGCDGAGTVASIGERVTRFRPGDDVYFVNGGYGRDQGTYAQYVVLNERFIAAKPKTLGYDAAAAFPLVLVTAWEALYDRADVRAGKTVVVQGGAGGVGHMAVQLANVAGANVIATVSSDEKARIARSLGAKHTIDYRTESTLERVLELTEGRGADVVFDTVGGATFTESVHLLDYYGTLVTCVERGFPAADPSRIMERNLRIAWTWMPAPQVFQVDAARVAQTQILEQGARLIDEGKLRAIVGARFPLASAAAAQRELENGRVTGKIVLLMEDGT